MARASAGRVRLHKYWIVAQPVEPPALRKGSAFEVWTVTESNARYEDYPRPAAVIRERFRQGGQCLAAYRNDVFVGYIWFNLGPYHEDEVRCRFVPQPEGRASWDYDAFVVERYRLGRAFKLLWTAAMESLYAHGVIVSYSRISAFNAGSLAAHTRLGAERVATLYFLRIGKVQWMLGTLTPYFGISFAPSCPPTVCVGPKRIGPRVRSIQGNGERLDNHHNGPRL
ncbi:MAG TPA: N-acetyltransferase [Gammaproteobacteria bacterium]|nr:N-acetyltransferase [Gammaproteobacteria bacterium]